ncbi:MAG: type II toxin-antitoxin system RelE/ParE family toxin [Gammaproteobacteria bacterium]|nr:type II toxin-antitoxin system RelE/ParE family toxin [Gammaproteobacteria bacterium]
MPRYTVRFTAEAPTDLERLYLFLLDKDAAARRALTAISRGIQLLRFSPWSCRKVAIDLPRHRELLVPFGSGGYVVLFEIEPPRTVTILAARHQREDDYH